MLLENVVFLVVLQYLVAMCFGRHVTCVSHTVSSRKQIRSERPAEMSRMAIF